MSHDKRARLKQWLESGEARLQPLSFPQRELWETAPVPPSDPANHICSLIQTRGLLAFEASRAAVQRVVDRQEALRISILPGKERPLQMVRQTVEANLRFRELSGTDATPEGIEHVAAEIFREPFDLVQGPLYRAEILRRAADEHVLVLAIHHAIADGWTLGVFVQDLFGSYMQGLLGINDPLPTVPQTYSAWGAAERAYWQPSEIAGRLDFWKRQLAGRPRLWSRADEPRAVLRPLQRWVTALPAALGTGARELARRSGATLFTTLLTAFQGAFAEWAKVDDFVVGTPVANRAKPSTHETMGYFAGNVPLRLRVEKGRPLATTLRAVHETATESFAYGMPFAELAAALEEPRVSGYHPIYEVRFALQNHPLPDVTMPNLSAHLEMRSTGTARFDLGCELTEQGDAIEAVWLFRAGQFSRAEIQELDRLFLQALTAACRA